MEGRKALSQQRLFSLLHKALDSAGKGRFWVSQGISALLECGLGDFFSKRRGLRSGSTKLCGELDRGNSGYETSKKGVLIENRPWTQWERAGQVEKVALKHTRHMCKIAGGKLRHLTGLSPAP